MSTKVYICAGSGGVGKTTIAAALGVKLAQKGERVLVLTIDPSKRLATSLGLACLEHNELKVPEQSYSGELFAAQIDTQKVFSDLLKENLKDEDVASIESNTFYKEISTTLAGSQEYSSLERLYKSVKTNKYDTIILDTPPAQHANDFLTAPMRFFSFFEDEIIEKFVTPPNKKGLIRSFFESGTKTVFKALETLTGGQFIEELSLFFTLIKGIKKPIQDHAVHIQNILTSDTTEFIIVTSFDEIKLNEAKTFYNQLNSRGYNISNIIINRAFPDQMPFINENIIEDQKTKDLVEYYKKIISYYDSKEKKYLNFENKEREIETIRIPEFSTDISKLKNLEKVSDLLSGYTNRDKS